MSSRFRTVSPMLNRRGVVLSALIAGVLCLFGGVDKASAHDGAIGEQGPFTVRIDSPATLPAGIEGRWGNGELELHVPSGVEVISYGLDGEAMAKVDKDGNMFYNTLSPTWAMNQSMNMDMGSGDAKTEPVWKWAQGGGSLQYHDHRIHFMAAAVDPSLANGGDVASFTLKFSVNDEPLEVKGTIVFDPSLDPAKAAELVKGTSSAGSGSGESDPGVGTYLLMGGVLLAGVVAFFLVTHSKKA